MNYDLSLVYCIGRRRRFWHNCGSSFSTFFGLRLKWLVWKIGFLILIYIIFKCSKPINLVTVT